MIEYIRQGISSEATPEEIAQGIASLSPDISDGDALLLAERLRPFLLSLSDALTEIMEYTSESNCGKAASFAAGEILLYVFDGQDLLSEERYGVIGLIDDAYLVHRFAGELSRVFPHASIDSSYTAPDRDQVQLVRQLLPDGIPQALDRMCQSVLQVALSLFGAGHANESPVAGQYTPTLRVSEALKEIGLRGQRK